jgi:hypothetical protein
MHSRVSPIDSRRPIAGCGCREFQPNRRFLRVCPARSDQAGKTTRAPHRGDCAHCIHRGYLRRESRPSHGLPAVAAVSGASKDERVDGLNGENRWHLMNWQPILSELASDLQAVQPAATAAEPPTDNRRSGRCSWAGWDARGRLVVGCLTAYPASWLMKEDPENRSPT